MIRQIHIRGFKSLLDQTIELGRVNCIIGANGVGKSNLLEALGVLSAASNGVVDDESLLRRGVRAGLPRLFKSSFASDRTPPHIALEAQDDRGAVYRVSLLNPLDAPEPAWTYKTELLHDGTVDIVADGVRNRKNLNPTAGLAALKMVELPLDNPAAILLKRLQQYAIYTPHTPVLRAITPDQQGRNPVGLNGGQLAEGFANILKQLEGDDASGEEILDQLYSLIDWVGDIQPTTHASMLLSPKVPRTKWMLKFVDRYMAASRNELTAYDASEGALYVIFAAVLCLSKQAPPLLAIDNLDQALNPRLAAQLVAYLPRWLAHNHPDRQILFTAHNPAVLDGLQLEDPDIRLFVADRNSAGHTTLRRITLSETLHELHQEYPLSRLWLMGHLGAVPHV